MFLSVVVPCYNEEEVIGKLYTELKGVILESKYFSDYELIFVDDGSSDSTLAYIKGINKIDKDVKYISFSRNFGKESAIYAGLQKACGDLVVLMDADLQHPPSLLNKMAEKITNEGYDSAGGVRKNRYGETGLKSVLSSNFYKLLNKLSDTEIKRNSTDFRMMNRRFVDSVLELSEYNRFTKGIFSWVGFKNAYIEFDNVVRCDGISKWNIRNLVKYSIEGMVAFSTKPLIISSILGFVMFVISSILLLTFLFKTILFGEAVRGFPTLICSIFFLGGIQLLTIGILGQYLSKTYLEVKNRPIYLTRETSYDRKNYQIDSEI